MTNTQYSDAQLQAYRALQVASERIGQNNYRNGLYRPVSKRQGYTITPGHRAIVDAMPKVLAGTLSVNDAMAMLHEYDTLKQRLA